MTNRSNLTRTNLRPGARALASGGAALLFAGLLAAGLLAGLPARAEEPPAAPAAPTAQTTFESPEAAVRALRTALEQKDEAALLAIFGPEARDLNADPADPAVQAERKNFLRGLTEKTGLETQEDGSVVLVVGKDDWPFPVPLVQKDGKWYFDSAAGKDEILVRRIGRNELHAIAICKAYAAAQAAYASEDRDGDRVREFAQRLASTEGQYDGLYWPSDPENGVEESPLADVGGVDLETFLASKEATTPFGGYHWKILTAQGANVPGGAYSFVINGNMIAGFALVGVPAKYGETGIMTILVSHHGKILEKDLGEGSIEAVKAMTAYDPDATWTEVGKEDLDAAESAD